MKYLLVVAAIFLTGCQTYHERFVYLANGYTNHIVDVSYTSCLMLGKAARLKTETQTGEFIRNVNADGLETKPDADTIKAISEGVTEGVLKGVGIP